MVHIYIYMCVCIYVYIYVYIYIYLMHITIWIIPWAVDLTGQFLDDLSVVDLQQRPWTGKKKSPRDSVFQAWGSENGAPMGTHGHPKFKGILVFPCFWTHLDPLGMIKCLVQMDNTIFEQL